MSKMYVYGDSTNVTAKLQKTCDRPNAAEHFSNQAGNTSAQKSLKVLQSITNKNDVVARDSDTKSKDLSGKKKIKVKGDKGKYSQLTGKDLETTGELSVGYWMALAETRRKALDETLIENELLHKQVVTLQEENELLRTLSKETEHLVDIVENLTDDLGLNDNEDEVIYQHHCQNNKEQIQLPASH